MAEEIKKDAVSDEQLENVRGGVDFDQLRRENLDKDAVDVDHLRKGACAIHTLNHGEVAKAHDRPRPSALWHVDLERIPDDL